MIGVLGFFMRRHGYPVAPLVVGMILGPMAEEQVRRTLRISQGELMALVASPFAALAYGVLIVVLAAAAVLRLRRRKITAPARSRALVSRTAVASATAVRKMCEVTDEEAHFHSISEVLGRRHRISGLDPESGTFELHDAERTVRVTLPLDLLAEYFTQLDEQDIPDLAHSPQDEQDRVRARHIIRSIEEIFESDIQLSLVAIQLDRSADGEISIVDRRGAARRSFPPTNAEGGYWSPDRPGT